MGSRHNVSCPKCGHEEKATAQLLDLNPSKLSGLQQSINDCIESVHSELTLRSTTAAFYKRLAKKLGERNWPFAACIDQVLENKPFDKRKFRFLVACSHIAQNSENFPEDVHEAIRFRRNVHAEKILRIDEVPTAVEVGSTGLMSDVECRV